MRRNLTHTQENWRLHSEGHLEAEGGGCREGRAAWPSGSLESAWETWQPKLRSVRRDRHHGRMQRWASTAQPRGAGGVRPGSLAPLFSRWKLRSRKERWDVHSLSYKGFYKTCCNQRRQGESGPPKAGHLKEIWNGDPKVSILANPMHFIISPHPLLLLQLLSPIKGWKCPFIFYHSRFSHLQLH